MAGSIPADSTVVCLSHLSLFFSLSLSFSLPIAQQNRAPDSYLEVAGNSGWQHVFFFFFFCLFFLGIHGERSAAVLGGAERRFFASGKLFFLFAHDVPQVRFESARAHLTFFFFFFFFFFLLFFWDLWLAERRF